MDKNQDSRSVCIGQKIGIKYSLINKRLQFCKPNCGPKIPRLSFYQLYFNALTLARQIFIINKKYKMIFSKGQRML